MVLMGKGGKGDYRWLQGDVIMFESHFVATCTGMMSCMKDLVEQIKIMMMGKMTCQERVCSDEMK